MKPTVNNHGPPPPVLFLDVDGVLNRNGRGLDAALCDLLAGVCRRTGCVVVVSSTWRKYPDLLVERLFPMFAQRGIRCIGQTPVLPGRPDGWDGYHRSAPRREEIGAWLEAHRWVVRYAIVDDDVDADDGSGRFVRTEGRVGLTWENARALEGILMRENAELSDRHE